MMRPKDLRQGSGTKTFLDAMHGGKVHLARFVLDALDGRIINSKTENSRTPLMFAVCLLDPGARGKFTRLLLEKGADVNSQDEHGRSALSLACELGHLDAVKLLVQFNADPDVSDAWGNSALMYAAYSGHSQVLEFLVRAFKRLGLRLDRLNHAGHSAIQVAEFFGHNQCVQVLNFPGRRGGGVAGSTEELVGEAGEERRRPSRLPAQVLERFSKQFHHDKNEDTLPGVFQRQLKIGDGGAGLWSRFRYPNNQPQENNISSSLPRTLPAPLQRSQTEEVREVAFTTKQSQNCTLRELRGASTMKSLPDPLRRDASRDRGLQKQALENAVPLWGKAKSFNLDLLSRRKQSYQGDMSVSASKLKRASLQDERSLIAKNECGENTCAVTNDADRTVTASKALSAGKNQSLRAAAVPEDGAAGSQRDESNDVVAQPSAGREIKKRGSLPPPTGRKLLFLRAEMEADKVPTPIRPPGFNGLGTRLLRRFTAPEFMRMVLDCSSGGSTHGRGRMSRSETFPFSHTHQKVNSQPSVDSISGVKCEFETSSSRVTLD